MSNVQCRRLTSDFGLRTVFVLLLLTSDFGLRTSDCLYGYTYRDTVFGFGDNACGFSARTAALGGVSVVSDGPPTAIWENPAEISVDTRGSFASTVELISNYERRLHSDAEATTATNSNSYTMATSAGVSISPLQQKFGFAAGIAKLFDANYDYEENVYGEVKITEKNILSGAGGIYAYGLGANYIPLQWLKLGITGFSITGDPELKKTEISYSQQTGLETGRLVTKTDNSYSGGGVKIGTVLQKDSFRFGISYTDYFSFENDSTVNGISAKYEYKMPSTLSGGVAVSFRGITRPTFLAQADYTRWGETSKKLSGVPGESWSSAGFNDTLNCRLGAEHWIAANVPLRYGLSVIQNPTRKGVHSSVVSIGSGFSFWQINIDAAFQFFMRRTTSEARIFPVTEETAYPLINYETVDDYTKRLLITGKIKW